MTMPRFNRYEVDVHLKIEVSGAISFSEACKDAQDFLDRVVFDCGSENYDEVKSSKISSISVTNLNK